MHIIGPLIQRLMVVGVLLLTLQSLYGQRPLWNGSVWHELIPSSERGKILGDGQYAENQWGRFVKNLDELRKFGAENWSIQSHGVSSEQAHRGLEERSKNLERIAGQIREFFQWYFNVPTPEIDSIPEEDLNKRLGRITSKVDEVLPLVIVAGNRGAALDVEAFPRMLRGLAEIEALSRALRN